MLVSPRVVKTQLLRLAISFHIACIPILIPTLLAFLQATLSLSPFLIQKLNKLGSDLYGTNGQQNIPHTTTEFIERLKTIIACKCHATCPVCVPLCNLYT